MCPSTGPSAADLRYEEGLCDQPKADGEEHEPDEGGSPELAKGLVVRVGGAGSTDPWPPSHPGRSYLDYLQGPARRTRP